MSTRCLDLETMTLQIRADLRKEAGAWSQIIPMENDAAFTSSSSIARQRNTPNCANHKAESHFPDSETRRFSGRNGVWK